jgi:signal transduction histidine kinase/FixJ family two-component response regulator
MARHEAGDPPRMYAVGFAALVGPGPLSLGLTCAFVVLCQIKINVTNAYAGSIAWSNFFSRLTHSHPGRVVWLVFNVAVALLVMELGVYEALERTLAFYSSLAVAWVGALVADLVINKPLGLSPPGIEFKRAHLYDINPVGVGAMAAATLLSTLAQIGAFGAIARAFSPFLALATALVVAPLIALATRGRFYLARQPEPVVDGRTSVRCCICENTFESEDTASCPAYAGPICSLCCSLDARCHDLCKPHARMHRQLADGLAGVVPSRWRQLIRPHVVEFALAFGLSTLLVAFLLALIGLQIGTDRSVDHAALVATMWKVFVLLLIVIGVGSWLFVLVQVSRRAAQDEMLRQTQLLMEEIEAHERTDAALKRAKEAAESANYAKSRYVVGLSHELRTPLNTIMGYAQLLERDQKLGGKQRGQVAVMRRSAGHLSGLIDGLLDISKVEAGKLDLSRDEIAIKPFLKQIVDMFAVQAAAKGIAFEVEIAGDLPETVASDEKRLRQIVINLLSNAMKFTFAGRVDFRVRYRNEVAEFAVIDTGPGIPPEDLERIFEPFERLQSGLTAPGTGLGLTICRLLARVMGGDILVESTPGRGSTFRLRLFLPRVNDTKLPAIEERLLGADVGAGRAILVVDDDATHRDVIAEAMTPLGFTLFAAETAGEGLRVADLTQPDLFLLDVGLPDMHGWQLAEQLRAAGHTEARIVMVSASAIEEHRTSIAQPFHDAYVMKPVDIARLTETILALLGLDVQDAPLAVPATEAAVPLESLPRPDGDRLAALIDLCEIGFVRGLREALADLATDARYRPLANRLLVFVDAVDTRGLAAALETLREPIA